MPRPKVRPEDRQRSVRACLPCKSSKIRCDAAEPCGPCTKRDRAANCTYPEPARKRQKTEDSASVGTNDPSSPNFVKDSTYHTPANGSDSTNLAHHPAPGQAVSSLTESRMLFTPRGERVYVGESASLSFLQFLRQILRNFMGPSAFTESHFKDSMLEMETLRDDGAVQTDLSRAEKLDLVQLYREASSGILDLYTVEEVHGFLDQHSVLSPGRSIRDDGRCTKPDQAALNMMIAIGCQCRGNNPIDNFNSARSFTCAQKIAFEGNLCDPSIDMVRIFTMMAFYMAQACNRNAAYMYTGIASKAACALGLHRKEQYRGLVRKEALKRWRTWKSLMILDTIISAILGRPGSISSLHPDDATNYNETQEVTEPDRTRWLSSRAVFSICSHVLDLQQRLGNGSNVDIATAEEFLRRLQRWKDSLPQELLDQRFVGGAKRGNNNNHTGSDDQPRRNERERFMGATHVSCLYYFTTILVTRPFLISHLMSSFAQRHGNNTTNPHPSVAPASSAKISDLAQACLDSALYLSRAGYMAVTSSLLSNNMCLLKAWTFAAGLVLGFSMFIDEGSASAFASAGGGSGSHSSGAGNDSGDGGGEDGERAADGIVTRADVEDAFHRAAHVLERLAEASPQARHYREILGALAEAVEARREQLAAERRRRMAMGPGKKYVDQIFAAEFEGDARDDGGFVGNGTGLRGGMLGGGQPQQIRQQRQVHPQQQQQQQQGVGDLGRGVGGVATTGTMTTATGVMNDMAADGSAYGFDPTAGFDMLDFGALDAWADIPLMSDNLYFDWGD